MYKIAKRFTTTELQSILINLQGGDSIARLIKEIENPDSKLLNPSCKGKFINMLPRLRTITADEEQTLKTFSTLFNKESGESNILEALQPFYSDNKTK